MTVNNTNAKGETIAEKRDAELKHEAMAAADRYGGIYETCTGYLEQVRDGHLSLDDAWDAILDKIAHLDGSLRDELTFLCFAWEETHKMSR